MLVDVSKVKNNGGEMESCKVIHSLCRNAEMFVAVKSKERLDYIFLGIVNINEIKTTLYVHAPARGLLFGSPLIPKLG